MIIQKALHWSQACRVDKGIVDRNECFCSYIVFVFEVALRKQHPWKIENETEKSAELLRQTENPKNSTPRVFPSISKRKAH